MVPKTKLYCALTKGESTLAHSSDYVIETSDLSKSFGPVHAVRSLDLQVPEHSIFAFLGPNGAGKSTTIKLLLGLVSPSGGTGTIFDRDIAQETTAIKQRVGYLAQNPQFYDRMTARETLRFVSHFFYSGPTEGIEERIQQTLELVDLADKADRPLGGFSGGEKQRLGIAQAQVNYPDLLILDEPAASLDPMGRRDVLMIMERLRKHATIFYSTHILDDVQRVSDTVAILNDGELVTQAPIEHLLSDQGVCTYEVQLRQRVEAVEHRLSNAPWVSTTTVEEHRGQIVLHVSVSDEKKAEAELLRLILEEPEVVVTGFGRRAHELEEAFLNIVQGVKE
jgi:ABC-2 type transport system ATP-binding protein